MMNKTIVLLIMCLPLLATAQTSNVNQTDGGIKWTTGLSWEQVKQKAKQENKYIFLDCFTTWCGPCKMMDKNVYVNDTVGDYFNDKFIAVKVQMDKTKKDNDEVQRWYVDAEKIGKEYHIEAFPTFTFISPAGTVVQKETGFRGVNDFIALAQTAIKPGKTYNDPYAEYERLKVDYKQGIKHYDRMVYMIKAALQFDKDLASQLIKDYTYYVSLLDATKRYNKENIEFWSMFTLSSTSKEFQFFYKDGNAIDKVMKQSGYAASEVDKTIFNEIVLPFLEKQNKNPQTQFGGMGIYRPDAIVDHAEADWKDLEKIIRQKYNRIVAHRNVLLAKKEWYERHSNKVAAARVYLSLINKFPFKEEPGELLFDQLNYKAWDAFTEMTDLKIINGYIPWMKMYVERFPDFHYYLDTYANLLYKAGKRKEAITWEEKALKSSISKGDDFNAGVYKLQLEYMKNGQPTYPGEANWDGIKRVKWEALKFQKVFNVKNSSGEWLSGVSIKIKDKDEEIMTQSKCLAAIKVSVGDIVIISKNGYVPQEFVVDKTPSSPTIVLRPLQ